MSSDIPDHLELLLRLERRAGVSLERQLLEKLRDAILQGVMQAGWRLPSTRALASALGISRNIVVAVYDELSVEGFLILRHGSGAYVSDAFSLTAQVAPPALARIPRWLPPAPSPLLNPVALDPDMIVFQPGASLISLLPLSVWRSTWQRVTTELPPSFYHRAAGDPELRRVLANYLSRSRGIRCTADDLILTASARHALHLLAEVTRVRDKVVGFEEPGYRQARDTLLAEGAQILPLPIDDDGLRVDALPTGIHAPPLVYVTPSHQYPLGMRLAITRRMDLLTWAEAHDSLVIEDDYDSEFRFDAAPLPALAAIDAHRSVAYIGTFSKTLSPALRLGYILAPRVLLERIEQRLWQTGSQISWPMQRALYTLLNEGHLERHIRRMRRHYAEKRALLSQILAPIAHLARLRGLEAGLHAYLELRAGLNARTLATDAWKRKVVVVPVDFFYYGVPDRQGLILGYGGLDHNALVAGATILREAIEQQARGL
jgi:GntR family transcriptional regulator/MocR family aminotransferase